MDLQALDNLRRAIASNGYRPIAVVTGAKRPAEPQWQERARAGEIPPPSPASASTGILCDRLRAIDIDVDDAETAQKVRDAVRERLGNAPGRWRQGSPRYAYLYRASEGSPTKRRLQGKRGAVEVLGHGQQLVAFGRHPEGAIYKWTGGSPADTHCSDLTPVSESDLEGLLQDLSPILAVEEKPRPAPAPPAYTNGSGGSRELAELSDLLDHIDPDIDHDRWIACGMALHCETAGSSAGLALFHRWSARGSKYQKDEPERRWRSFNGNKGVTGATLAALARDAGGADLSRIAVDNRLRTEPPPPAPTSAPPPANAAPASILVRPGELHHMATEAESALLAAGAPFYARGGEIMRPITDEVDAARGSKARVARLEAVDINVMVDHLSRAAAFQRPLADGTFKSIDPPQAVAKTILSRDGEWRLPRLTAVITTPTVRPDGSVLCGAGYDAATRLLLVDPPHLPRLTERPSREDAEAALALLDDLLSAFPFADDASRAVALSALITPTVRGALPVAPMHVAKAPTAGSGKSYLVDVAAAIATGQPCPVVAAGRDEAETEKRLGAALLAGFPILSVDNVNGPLGGDAMCQAIERPVVLIRVLGFSQMKRIEGRATLFATGNNILPTGDMTRRVLLCSLDADMERPELRVFRDDPLAKVLADRGRYVAACLTVVRAYQVAGQPDLLPDLASFDAWSRMVRSALVWLGREDPVDTIEKVRGQDPEMQRLSALLSTWAAALDHHGERLTTGQLKHRTEGRNADLRAALMEVAARGTDIDTRRLGGYLSRMAGRVAGGFKLVGEKDSHAKQRVWGVRPVN